MNSTISTFLKIAITVVSISAFLFFVGYNLIGSEVDNYKTKIVNVETNIPDGMGAISNNK